MLILPHRKNIFIIIVSHFHISETLVCICVKFQRHSFFVFSFVSKRGDVTLPLRYSRYDYVMYSEVPG